MGRGPDTGVCLTDLGCTLLALGEHRGALIQFQEALAITEDIDGGASRNAAIDRGNTATAHCALGELEQADALWESVFVFLTDEWDVSDTDWAWAWNHRGTLRLEQGRAEDARDCFSRAHELTRDESPFRSPVVPVSWNNWAVANALRDPGVTKTDLASALDLATNFYGALHPGTLVIAANLAACETAAVPSEALARLRSMYAAVFSKPRAHPFLTLNVPYEGQSFTMQLVTAA